MVLGGDLPAWAEFGWVGRTVALGGVTFAVVKRTVRCEGVNVDPAGGRELDIPGLLQRHFPQHGPYLGVYAQVVGGGVLRVGDRLAPAAAG